VNSAGIGQESWNREVNNLKSLKLPLPPEIQLSVAEMFEAYAEACDSGHLQKWHEFFTDDAIYRVTSRENYQAGLAHGDIYCEGLAMIRDRADALLDSTVYEPRALRHLISHPRIELLSEKRLAARTSFLVIEAMSDDEPQIYMSGTYVDELAVQDAQLKFSKRVCVYDNYRIRTSLVYPV